MKLTALICIVIMLYPVSKILGQSKTNSSSQNTTVNRATNKLFQSIKNESTHISDSLFADYRFETIGVGVGLSADYIKASDFITAQVPHFYIALQREIPLSAKIAGKLVIDHVIGGTSYNWQTRSGESAGNIVFINIGLRFNYLFPLNERFSPYGGIGLLYNQPITLPNDQFEDLTDTITGQFSSDLFVGMRYHMSSSMDLFGELGLGFLNVKAGIVIKRM